jgi:tetraacyldisaccharide 4'-kinase
MRAPDFWRAGASLAARALAPLGALYGTVAAARLAHSGARAPLPTFVIGGLTAGGDGKTPTALALAQLLTQYGERPALLTRGYGREAGASESILVDTQHHAAHDVGDEPLLLARAAPTFVGADRIASAQRAQSNGATVLVLDDGFHSRRLAPDLALLITDGAYGAGNGRCLPAGPLRAPLDTQLAQADALVLIGEGDAAAAIAARAKAFGKLVLHATMTTSEDAATLLRDKKMLAFAGLARPEKFQRSLQACGADVVATRWFDDHHLFTQREVDDLRAEARRLGATLATTEKDAARLSPENLAGIEIVAATLTFEDPEALQRLIHATLVKARVAIHL